MQNMTSLGNRIAAGISALAISAFLIAASFAPPGALALSTGVVA